MDPVFNKSQSETDFRQLLGEVIEHLSQGLSYFDRDLNLVVCNRRYLELLDFPDEMGEPGTPLSRHFQSNLQTQHEYTKSHHFSKSCFLQSLDTSDFDALAAF